MFVQQKIVLARRTQPATLPLENHTSTPPRPSAHQRAVSWRAALHVRRQQHGVQEHPRVRCSAVAVAVAITAAAAADNVTHVIAARDPLCCLGQIDNTLALTTGVRKRREARVLPGAAS